MLYYRRKRFFNENNSPIYDSLYPELDSLALNNIDLAQVDSTPKINYLNSDSFDKFLEQIFKYIDKNGEKFKPEFTEHMYKLML